MKKNIMLSIFILSIITLILGVFILSNGNNSFKKGIYFRKTFGYIGFVNENINLDLYYINVKNAEFTNNNLSSLSLITENDEVIEIDNYSVRTTYSNKLYTECTINISINEVYGIYSFCKIRLYDDSNHKDYNIGNINIESITTDVAPINTWKIRYALSLVNYQTTLSLTNIHNTEINVIDVKVNFEYINDDIPKNLLFKTDEHYDYNISIDSSNVSEHYIILIKPIIEFQYTSDNTIYYTTIFGSIKRVETLSVDSVYDLISEN